MTPHAFFCTHGNFSGFSEIASSRGFLRWMERYGGMQQTASAPIAADINASSIRTMVCHATERAVGAKQRLRDF